MEDEEQSTLTGDFKAFQFLGHKRFTWGLSVSHAQYAPLENFTAKETHAPHSSQKQK